MNPPLTIKWLHKLAVGPGEFGSMNTPPVAVPPATTPPVPVTPSVAPPAPVVPKPATPDPNPVHAISPQVNQQAAGGDVSAVGQINETMGGATPAQRFEASRNLAHGANANKWFSGVRNWFTDRTSPEDLSKSIANQAGQTGQQFGTDTAAAATKAWSGKEGGWWNYLKQNPSLLMLPMGIMVALMSKGNMGRIAGVLAAAGGAANLWGRYNAIKDPKFLSAVRDHLGGKLPDQQFLQQYGSQWKDLQAVQASGLVNLPQMGRQAGVDMVRNIVPDQSVLAGASKMPQPAPAAAPVVQ